MKPDEVAQNFFKHLQRAELLIEVDRWREALHELNQHLAASPDSYIGLCQSALCHYQLKEYQKAFDLTKRAIEVDPENEWAYRLQSNIFTANGEPKRSLEAAQTCIEKDPESAYSIQCLFWAQANYGALDDAEKTLKSLLEAMPDTSNAHEAAGYLALERKNFYEAEKHFLEALEIDPESVNALNNLGVVYLNLTQRGKGHHYKKKSVEMFERAVKTQPTFKLGQQNMSIASNAVKVGAPIGLVFLIWVGLRIVSSVLRSGFNDEVPFFSVASTSHFVTGANILSLLVLVGIAVIAVACAFVNFREPLLYELGTLRGWLVIFSVFGAVTILYAIGFWVLESSATPFASLAFGFSLLLFVISGINVVHRWIARRTFAS